MEKNTKTYEEKITGMDERIRQLINEKKKLQQQENAQQRKARDNRLYRRHGLLEKYMPGLTIITDRQFEIFIQRAINTSYGQKILAELVAESGQSIDCMYIESPKKLFTEGGADTPKAEPSGA
jgi:hypothetical protein